MSIGTLADYVSVGDRFITSPYLQNLCVPMGMHIGMVGLYAGIAKALTRYEIG
jgi:hypothetical protein